MSSRWRGCLWLVIGILAVGGAGGHLVYWYGARFRSLPVEKARLLPAPSSAEMSVWIPFPHQNARALEEELSDPEETLAAVGRLLGREGLRLPRIEPFGVPPAREAGLRTFPGGGESIQMAVYPLVRWSSRVAGALAGNPWLRGGSVRYGGRGASVSWSSGIWALETPPVPPETGSEAARLRDSRERVWSRISSRRPIGPLPPGHYDLTWEDPWVRLAPVARRVSVPELPEGAVLLIAERRGSSLRALALSEGSSIGVSGFRLPGLAVLAPDREEAARLFPGHRMLRTVGATGTRAIDGQVAMVSDETLFPLADDILRRWEPWMAREGVGVVARIRRAESAVLAEGVADLLEAIPLAPEGDRRRWRDGATVLSAFEDLEGIVVWGPAVPVPGSGKGG